MPFFEYHERTKYHLNRYAAGPGGLDWADQPDPFRRFKGCERISLPLPEASLPVCFAELHQLEGRAVKSSKRTPDSSTAPALPYLLRPCSRPASRRV
jgi:hypothetical protein